MGVLNDDDLTAITRAVARRKRQAAIHLALETLGGAEVVSTFDALYAQLTQAFDDANDQAHDPADMLARLERACRAIEATYRAALEHEAVREAYDAIRAILLEAPRGRRPDNDDEEEEGSDHG